MTTSLPVATVGTAYTHTLQASGGTGSDTWGVASGSSLPAGLALSSSGTLSGTPTTAGSPAFTVQVTDGAGVSATQSLSLTVQPAAPPAWTPPVLTPESVTVGTVSTDVIGNLGYNPATAIQRGIYAGYVEERAAIEAGASFSGEGTDSAYLSAILDGSGVGINDPHVSPEQQGQFAALYQKLGIIPMWTDNAVTLPQGLTALAQVGAPALAMENYLVQLDGYSWTAAASQAAAGFPIKSGT